MGDYIADILVEDALVIELKCVERLASGHTAQCFNYLTASGLSAGDEFHSHVLNAALLLKPVNYDDVVMG